MPLIKRTSDYSRGRFATSALIFDPQRDLAARPVVGDRAQGETALGQRARDSRRGHRCRQTPKPRREYLQLLAPRSRRFGSGVVDADE